MTKRLHSPMTQPTMRSPGYAVITSTSEKSRFKRDLSMPCASQPTQT